MKVLGISAYYHDSAAALVVDGNVVAAAQEERFSRVKHDARLPIRAIRWCLAEGQVEPENLDAVVYYEDPWQKLDRTLAAGAAGGVPARAGFAEAAERLLGSRLWLPGHLRQLLGKLGREDRLWFVDHHVAHAASAFFPSPFAMAAVVTIDGVGEWATTTISRGEDERIEMLGEIEYPHSLGLLYSAFTQYCGFRVNSGEYKLMGLAPYGKPCFASLIRDHLIDLREDGSFRLDMRYFGFLEGRSTTNARFEGLFGGPAREPESRLESRHADLAASIQVVLEDAVERICRRARALSGCANGVLAGGVALNCVANGRLLERGVFERLWVQPAAGDAGGALGAALAVSHGKLGVPRRLRTDGTDGQQGSLLGPAFSTDAIRRDLDRLGRPYVVCADDEQLHIRVAQALSAGLVVGYFRGRMEFGPRALGARSILGDPRDPRMQARMNLKIKFRESFRPFAPAVLAEKAPEYFSLGQESPYMLVVAPVRPERRRPFDLAAVLHAGGHDLLAAVNAARSDIPAVTHVDYSARVQTVSRDIHPDFHALLEKFEAATGCPVCINTSFNVRGEPIVCTPEDAYRCFMRSDIDLLVLGRCVLEKRSQPPYNETGDWRSDYVLD